MERNRDEREISAIGRLLQEISWEGNARRYHDGGMGLENVLTVEVFSALDFLPRTAFLGSVLRAAHGADAVRAALAEDIEGASVELLVGDMTPVLEDGSRANWSVQPDAFIESGAARCLVEAKRLRSSRFAVNQISRCLRTVMDPTIDKPGFVLLVLPDDPPIRVNGHGRMDLAAAMDIGLRREGPIWDQQTLEQSARDHIAWITWHELEQQVRDGLELVGAVDTSARAAITRLAQSVSDAVRRHG